MKNDKNLKDSKSGKGSSSTEKVVDYVGKKVEELMDKQHFYILQDRQKANNVLMQQINHLDAAYNNALVALGTNGLKLSQLASENANLKLLVESLEMKILSLETVIAMYKSEENQQGVKSSKKTLTN